MNSNSALGAAGPGAPAADVAAALKLGLRALAKAVAVISCRQGQERFAMTATAVSELSMDPPSMLICVNRTASLFAPLTEGADFCINILQATQADISHLCSGKAKGEARFALGSWRESDLGVPYLEEAQASIVCRSASRFEFGTHGIFLGTVEQVLTRGPFDPLVYMDGRYGAFAPRDRSALSVSGRV